MEPVVQTLIGIISLASPESASSIAKPNHFNEKQMI